MDKRRKSLAMKINSEEDVAFRIAGKIFAYLKVDDSRMIVMKCDPEKAVELREEFPGIIEPAFHWNKKYWNRFTTTVPRLTKIL